MIVSSVDDRNSEGLTPDFRERIEQQVVFHSSSSAKSLIPTTFAHPLVGFMLLGTAERRQGASVCRALVGAIKEWNGAIRQQCRRQFFGAEFGSPSCRLPDRIQSVPLRPARPFGIPQRWCPRQSDSEE